MKKYLSLPVLLLSICFLTACPAPEYNHVIINQSKTILEVEYEYLFPKGLDFPELTNPSKMALEKYENEDQNKQWTDLTTENEYKFETRSDKSIEEKFAADSNTNQESKLVVKKVTLKLLPGEVLRVFYSKQFPIEPQLFLGFKLRGEDGKLEISGTLETGAMGFYPFSAYRPNRFFTDTKDYRIVYR